MRVNGRPQHRQFRGFAAASTAAPAHLREQYRPMPLCAAPHHLHGRSSLFGMFGVLPAMVAPTFHAPAWPPVGMARNTSPSGASIGTWPRRCGTGTDSSGAQREAEWRARAHRSALGLQNPARRRGFRERKSGIYESLCGSCAALDVARIKRGEVELHRHA